LELILNHSRPIAELLNLKHVAQQVACTPSPCRPINNTLSTANEPFDGVFNQSDDMILLSLFIRVITGSAPRKVVHYKLNFVEIKPD